MMIPDVDPYYSAAAGAALVALVVVGLVLRDARQDLKAVRASGIRNGRLRIARTELRFEIHRTIVVSLLGAAAIGATILTAGSGIPETWVAFVPRVALLGAMVTMVVDAVAAIRYRVWLRETYHPHHDDDATVEVDELEEADHAV